MPFLAAIPAAAIAVGAVAAGTGAAVGAATSYAAGEAKKYKGFGYQDPTEKYTKSWGSMLDSDAGLSGKAVDEGKAFDAAGKNLDEDRTGMKEVADQYRGVIAGKTPSLAEMQMQAGANQAVQEAANTAAGAQGEAALGMAAQNRQQAQGQLLNQNKFDTGMLRAKETEVARQGLLGAQGQMAAMDAHEQEIRNQRQQYYESMGWDVGKARMQADAEFQQWKANAAQQTQAGNIQLDLYNRGVEAQKIAGMGSAISSGISSMGQLGMMGLQSGMGGAGGGMKGGGGMDWGAYGGRYGNPNNWRFNKPGDFEEG